MTERKADRTYILTERQFIESVLVGATTKRYLPPGIAAEAQRAQVETAENGGVVVRVWLGPIATALEPQVLQPLLKQFASELPGPVPTITEVRLWREEELLEVSNWVRALHARAHPIAGMVLPDPGDQPLVLFEVVRPDPAKPAKKAKVAKKAAKKARLQKGSLGDAQALEARASKRRREEEAESAAGVTDG